MPEDQVRYNQVNNIIRRSHALILNIQLLGADVSHAKELLDTAKTALESGDYDSAIENAKKSMVEVITLKKEVKAGRKLKKPSEPKMEPKDAKEKARVEKEKDIDLSLDDIDKKPSAPKQSAEDKSDKKLETPSAEVTGIAQETLPTAKDFENGFSYLIEENRADKCFNIFSNLASTDYEGLCICRTNPAIIMRKYSMGKNITMLWLTDRESAKESTISPSLESMIYVAEEFIDKNEKALILLDGLEYLISNNSFNPVLRFIRRLIDKISETNSILMIGVGSKAINEQELRLLERELNPVVIN